MNANKTGRRERLVAALAVHDTLKAAAEAADIPYESARRMLREPEVQEKLAELWQQMAKEAVLEAANLACLARETLRQVMEDKHAPPHARVRASEVALTYERAVAELFDVHQRLEAIEARLTDKTAA